MYCLYDPTEGKILLNGIDIRKYNYREYMDIFSVVFQDFRLLSLKLGENVAGKVYYDKELVIDCLDKAGFADRFIKMRDGTETYLYKDAPFIILDEPTANTTSCGTHRRSIIRKQLDAA